MLALPATALADHVEGRSGWYVEYNESGRLDDNYSSKAFAEDVSKLQPGDDITLTVETRQSNETPADWYISNEVIKSLEDGDASGSAYGYKLTYEGSAGSKTLYASESVGGTGSSAGLAEATNAMDGYFYLGTLSKGDTGKVVLNVSLDGETEGNAYFDTLAQLGLKFAVEPQVSPERRTEHTTNTTNVQTESTNQANRTRTPSGPLAKTGDMSSVFPLYLAIAGLGIICLALGIRNLRSKREEKEDAR